MHACLDDQLIVPPSRIGPILLLHLGHVPAAESPSAAMISASQAPIFFSIINRTLLANGSIEAPGEELVKVGGREKDKWI
jgi:hypothetical protein